MTSIPAGSQPCIGIALIGFGKIARDQHLAAVRGSARYQLAAIVDPAATEGVADVPLFADLAALRASQLPVDAVAICTPPQARAAIAREAIAAGWHVLLEKPPAATLAELAELSALAAAAGPTLFAAWHSREAPMVATARSWLAGKDVVRGGVTWREDVRQWHPGQGWLWAPGGLGVFDPGINAFSILTEILPSAPMVTHAVLEVPANAHTPIAARLVLRSGGGTIEVELDFRHAVTPSWDITLETRCGHRLVLANGGARLTIDEAPPQEAMKQEYAGLYARFASLISAGESDADAAPLRLVADALLIAETRAAAPFVD